MPPGPLEALTPRILVVDDESQIHASLRLRLGREYKLDFAFNGPEALALIRERKYDLCITDIHMPKMDGLTFIGEAREIDPELAFVVLTAFDSQENLKRAIPLQVLQFVEKPILDRAKFDDCVPGWVEHTRRSRRERELAQEAAVIAHDRDAARLERDVEFVVSETLRDAFLQSTSLQTSVHAHLVAAVTQIAARAKGDPFLTQILRGLEQGVRAAEAASAAAEDFWNSGYAKRDGSPALPHAGLRDAVDIVCKNSPAEKSGCDFDLQSLDDRLTLTTLSGIDYLLMMVPILGVALSVAPPDSTIRIMGNEVARLDVVRRDAANRELAWFNRSQALMGQPALVITLANPAPSLARDAWETWSAGKLAALSKVPALGLARGIEKCRGLIGVSLQPAPFRVIIALPR